MKASTILPLIAVMTVTRLSAADQDFDPPEVIPGTPAQDAEPPQIASAGKNVYLLWHEFPTATSTQPDVFLARSTNRGDSFAARINVSVSADVDSRTEDIAAEGHNVYVAWVENVDQISFSRSTNNAQSFGTARVLSSAAGADLPQIASHDDDVFVVWQAIGNSGATDIFFAESDDGGNTFGAERNISDNPGDSVAPQILVSGDHVIITWSDGSTPGLDREIFVVRGE